MYIHVHVYYNNSQSFLTIHSVLHRARKPVTQSKRVLGCHCIEINDFMCSISEHVQTINEYHDTFEYKHPYTCITRNFLMEQVFITTLKNM